jgi:DNA-binding protein WhiA
VFLLPATTVDWGRAAEHCRLAWLRGRFLATGSLSLAGGRAHLEFVVAPDEAPRLVARLADAGLPAAWRVRRRRGVVTAKSAEAINGFLGRIGGSAALLELQARSVARSLRGDLNRVINAESANLNRSVAAAGRQLAAIDALEADGRLHDQPRTVRAVAEARRETPEASLSEIAVRLDLHRSAVQRALDRLERLALHDDEGIGRRGGGLRAVGPGRPVPHGGREAGSPLA